MAGHTRHPVLIGARQRGAWTFSYLYTVESVARATLSTVLPLVAYEVFGSKETLSLVYTCVALVAFLLSFAIPLLVGTLSRRWTYTLGAALLVCSSLALVGGVAPAVVFAIGARSFGSAIMNVTINLYILDNIAKQDLVRSEPLRFSVSTGAWTVAPFLGVWLYSRYGIAVPAGLSIAAAVLAVGSFWYLRLSERGPISAGRVGAPNPLRSIRRFAEQPRLQLAWLIAFGRSIYWVTFFIYVPILMVDGGYGPTATGLVIALGNLALLTNLVAARIARWLTLRRVISWVFWLSGLFVFATGFLAGTSPISAAGLMVAAAPFVSILDGLGPIPFLRAVRNHERPQMTTVYRTYLDVSEFLPPLVYAGLFVFFGLGAAFWALGLSMAAVGLVASRHLPARL